MGSFWSKRAQIFWDKMPTAGGQGAWAQIAGLALAWPVGQELKCWSPPGRPLSRGLCDPRSGGHPHPSSDPLGQLVCLLGSPAPPGVGAAPSGPSHYLPEGPLWLGTCANSRPQPSTPREPGPAPSPAHTETTWRGCNRHGSGETGETCLGAGPATGQMDGWDVTATPPRESRAAGPGRDRAPWCDSEWSGHRRGLWLTD